MIYFSEKQYDNALKEFRTALEDDPESISVRYYLALVLEEMGKYDEAVVELKEILEKDPKNINAFLHLAYIYSKMKRDEDAVKIYEEILEFEKENPDIYIYLANTHMKLRDYAKAESVLTGRAFKVQQKMMHCISILLWYLKRPADLMLWWMS